jgi:hypothetical protein
MWADAPKGQQPCFGRLQQESNNDQVICCCLRTGLGVIGAGHAPGTPPTAGQDCHSNPRSMRTGYAPHCEWCLHQNSHPTWRQQVRSWSDLLTSRGRREAAFLFSRWMSEFGPTRTSGDVRLSSHSSALSDLMPRVSNSRLRIVAIIDLTPMASPSRDELLVEHSRAILAYTS